MHRSRLCEAHEKSTLRDNLRYTEATQASSQHLPLQDPRKPHLAFGPKLGQQSDTNLGSGLPSWHQAGSSGLKIDFRTATGKCTYLLSHSSSDQLGTCLIAFLMRLKIWQLGGLCWAPWKRTACSCPRPRRHHPRSVPFYYYHEDDFYSY